MAQRRSVPSASGWYAIWGKRMFDLLLVVPLALVSAPIALVVAILVRLRLGSPVLFRQERPGWNGRVFGMVNAAR